MLTRNIAHEINHHARSDSFEVPLRNATILGGSTMAKNLCCEQLGGSSRCIWDTLGATKQRIANLKAAGEPHYVDVAPQSCSDSKNRKCRCLSFHEPQIPFSLHVRNDHVFMSACYSDLLDYPPWHAQQPLSLHHAWYWRRSSASLLSLEACGVGSVSSSKVDVMASGQIWRSQTCIRSAYTRIGFGCPFVHV